MSMIEHVCWYGGEPLSGSQYWYECKEHDVQWSGTCGSPNYAGHDPDFSANASSPA